MRALRVDKLTYAALEGTLLGYLAGRPIDTIPAVRMLAMSRETIEARARGVVEATGLTERFEMQVADGESMVGGGSAPGVPVATRVLVLHPGDCDATALETDLRGGDPPVIARVEQDGVLLDLRTVLPEEDEQLVKALRAAGTRAPTQNG